MRWRCDNQAAVFAVMARSCRDKSLMHLQRCLFFFEAHYQFELGAEYLPGVVNTLADDLSRNRSSSFLRKAPQMRREPSQVPPQLPRLLLKGVDWTSPHWTAKAPQMRREPSQVPPQLPWLLLEGVDWTSPHWTATFTSLLTGV